MMCKINACVILVVAIFMHIIMALTLVTKILFLTGMQPFDNKFNTNEFSIIFFSIGFILTMIYYNEKRINKIVEEYADTKPNGLYGFLIIIIPLIVMMLTIISSVVSE